MDGIEASVLPILRTPHNFPVVIGRIYPGIQETVWHIHCESPQFTFYRFILQFLLKLPDYLLTTCTNRYLRFFLQLGDNLKQRIVFPE